MGTLGDLYRSSLALLTDLYQLTMAYGYWRAGMAEREAVFHLYFRNHPFGGGLAVAAGLGPVVEYVDGLVYDDADLAYLAGLTGADGRRLFDAAFLDYLRRLRFTCQLDGVLEGTVVFSHEPLLRVRGPLIQAQLLETPLLNLVNFPTLIATKAARVVLAAAGDPVLEFGLRRAQGVDGALTASRAAYIGGCAATSNVLAGRLYGIPVRGTHAHSWVMCFPTEREAFLAYAEAMPNNCVFLVDTYDTLDGVRRAVEAGRWLRQRGHEMVGVRLDSGDLASLSIQARRILDEGGFPHATIVASSDLDEYAIAELKARGATIAVWGVGTRLATAYDQPALGGIYKLTALRDLDGTWQYLLKLSEEAAKASCPGILQVRRHYRRGRAVGDMIFDVERGPSGERVLVGLREPGRRTPVPANDRAEDLLVPVIRDGRPAGTLGTLEEARKRAQSQLAMFDEAVKRLVDPEAYPVGLDPWLDQCRKELAEAARRQ